MQLMNTLVREGTTIRVSPNTWNEEGRPRPPQGNGWGATVVERRAKPSPQVLLLYTDPKATLVVCRECGHRRFETAIGCQCTGGDHTYELEN
eukprot:3749325-Rhodomonas_salina.1